MLCDIDEETELRDEKDDELVDEAEDQPIEIGDTETDGLGGEINSISNNVC